MTLTETPDMVDTAPGDGRYDNTGIVSSELALLDGLIGILGPSGANKPFLLTRFINGTLSQKKPGKGGGYKYVIDVSGDARDAYNMLKGAITSNDIFIRSPGKVLPLGVVPREEMDKKIDPFLKPVPYPLTHHLANKMSTYRREVGQPGKDIIDFKKLFGQHEFNGYGANIGKYSIKRFDDLRKAAFLQYKPVDESIKSGFFETIFKGTGGGGVADRRVLNAVRKNIADGIIKINEPRTKAGWTDVSGLGSDSYTGSQGTTGEASGDGFVTLDWDKFLQNITDLGHGTDWIMQGKKQVHIPGISIAIGENNQDKLPTVLDDLVEVEGCLIDPSFGNGWDVLSPAQKQERVVKLWVVRTLDYGKGIWASQTLGQSILAGAIHKITGAKTGIASGMSDYNASHALFLIDIPRNCTTPNGEIVCSDIYTCGYGFTDKISNNLKYKELSDMINGGGRGGGILDTLGRLTDRLTAVQRNIWNKGMAVGLRGLSRAMPHEVQERHDEDFTGCVFTKDGSVWDKVTLQRGLAWGNMEYDGRNERVYENKSKKEVSQIKKTKLFYENKPYIEVVDVFNMPPSQVRVIQEAIYKTYEGKKYYVENNTLKIYEDEFIKNKVTFEYTVDFYIVDQNNSYSKMSNSETGCQNCASFITNACKNLVSCSSPFVDIPVQCSTVLNGVDYRVTDNYNIGNTPYGSIIIGQYMWDTVPHRLPHPNEQGGGGMVGGGCKELEDKIIEVAKYIDILYTVILVYGGKSADTNPSCHLADERAGQSIDYIENSAVSAKGVSDYLEYLNYDKNVNEECQEHINDLKELIKDIGPTTVLNTGLSSMGVVGNGQVQDAAAPIQAPYDPYEMMKDTILAYFGEGRWGTATEPQESYITAASACYIQTEEDIPTEERIQEHINYLSELFSYEILLLLDDDFFIRFGDNKKRKKETIEDRHRLGRPGGGKKITHRKHRRKQKHTRRSKPNKKKRTKKHRKKRKYTKYRR